MAFIEEAHVADVGTILRITVYDTDSTGGTSVLDISSATTKTIYLRSPAGDVLTKSASFTTDGTDGKMQNSTIASDLSVAGTWGIQGLVASDTTTHHTSTATFRVFENLS